MTTLSQKTFSSGEISPSLYARVDLTKYATGLRTCKNNIILRYGGASNRPGTEYINEASDSTKAIRLIPFIFNTDQTYVLEFGQLYMRVIKNGAQLRETGKTITAVTKADPCVVSAGGHGYTTGDEVYLSGIEGMTELNGRSFKINVLGANDFEIQLMDGVDVDSTGYTTHSGTAGISEKVYEIVTTYTAPDLSTLNYVQSADTLTLVHPSYAPAELTRTSDTAWALADLIFQPNVDKPTAVAAVKGGAGSETYRYKVTAIDEETGEESLPGVTAVPENITAISEADPARITIVGHNLVTDDDVYITGIVGMVELNNRTFTVTVIDVDNFDLNNEDSTAYTSWVSGGTVTPIFTEITSAAVATTAAPHVISWTKPAGDIREYNIYRETNGIYGQIGIAQGTSFDDINITPNTTYTPPSSRNPFIGAGNYPSTVTYIQQRLAFANTDNDTEKVFLSRTANFKNFTKSSPLQDDDAITFTMAGRQVNEVKALLDLGRLVMLSSGGEWSAEGDSGVLTPTAINTKQYSYNGSGDLQPITIDGAALYQQARGSIIRDLGYDFQIDGYKGNDLTIFSAHLFDKFTLVDWAYQQIPHSILWVVRSDGALLGMTFVRNQEVIAWHRHDTQGGTFENVVVVPEGNEDVLYVTVRRTINGKVVRFVEKLATRQITNIVENKFMDSHLTYDGRNTSATTMTLSGGTDWLYTETLTLTASVASFAFSDIGNAIHIRGASNELIRATITAYTSTTIVEVTSHKTVPVDLRTIAVSDWDFAVDAVGGLWHLEGEEVAVFGDGFVVASPFNTSYDTITVTNGIATLDKPYGVVHVGLPYISDLETLDVDTPNGESIADKYKIVGSVTLFVEETRGVWVGSKPPSNDVINPLEDLIEYKIRAEEDYDSPVELKTDKIGVNIRAEWNSNGRVFIRQIDPIPSTILSISPAGKFPFSGGN